MTLDDFRQSLTAAKPPAELTLALAGLLCLTKMPSGPGRTVFFGICVRGFRHLLGFSSEHARASACERGSAQISRSESEAAR